MTTQKEKERLYGQTLADFVNAKNLNEAYFGLIENIQKVFGFSPSFKKKIKAPLYDLESIPEDIGPAMKEVHDLRNRILRPLKNHSSISQIEECITALEHSRRAFYRANPQRLEDDRMRLKTILTEMAITPKEGLSPDWLDSVSWLLIYYNASTRPFLTLDMKNGFVKITPKDPFEEDDFIKTDREEILHKVLDSLHYIAIEFLRSPTNWKLIRKCACGRYFPASKDDPRIKKCSSCSPKSSMTKERRRAYQREYNRRRKEEKGKREFEAKIQNFMENLDCTREEAIEIIEADAKL
jgi:hypothetical protein